MAAPTINIPSEALPDLKTIAGLEDELFNALILAIQETEPTLTRGQMARRIAEKVKLPEATLRAVLGTAFVLFNLKEKSGVAIQSQELADSIVNSEVVGKSADFPAATKSKLGARLVQLIALDTPLGITSKAVDVMTEHERIYCGARILSDIRPVFSGKTDSASGAVIVHNLQIGFHQMGKHQEFYVALDTDDIKALKSVIERAEQKTVALESILKKSNVPYLRV